jgi:hypothetical protein
MGAVLDLFRVLFSPSEVFERVRERPKFLVPALAICVIAIILSYFMLPYRAAAMASRMAEIAQQNPGAAAQAAKFQLIGLAFVPIGVFVLLLIVGGILWLLVTLLAGGEGKYRTLLSVATYTALPGLLLQVAGLIVLSMKGVESVSTMQDLQPALGLNLLAPNVGGFMGGLLAGINPFSIWSMVLTAIGVQVTHKTSKGSAYTVAIVAMMIGVLIGALFAGLGSRSGG